MFENGVFSYSNWLSFSYFYLAYQISYCYLPFVLLVSINICILYTIYELMFMPMLGSSNQRDEKLKQVKRNETTIIFLTLNFGLTALPNEIFKTILFFHFEMINLNGIYFLLNFVELSLIFFNFIFFIISLKNLRRLICNFSLWGSKKKTVDLVVDGDFVPMETNL